MDKSLVSWNEKHLPKILKFHNRESTFVGGLPVVNDPAFVDHNQLIRINSVFSKNPRYMPVDRTLSTKHPFRYWVPRTWQVPTVQWTLDKALEERVKSLVSHGKKINLFWSGGIDSTTMLTAFLRHADLQQIRIMYSPWSTYEHPGYLEYLKSFNGLELMDISGTLYLNWDYDGLIVTGDGGDELSASIDESFLENYKSESLYLPWKDFFYKQHPDLKFIEFCESFFSQSKRPIETVLQARWWFYASCKNRSILNYVKLPLFFDNHKNIINEFIGFFDCNEFENYIYWNIEDIFSGTEYSGWKQVLKNYACAFDGFEEWRKTKAKYGSVQILIYTDKKMMLQEQNWLALISDGTKSTTPSLPVLTELEYQKYNDLTWAFNDC